MWSWWTIRIILNAPYRHSCSDSGPRVAELSRCPDEQRYHPQRHQVLEVAAGILELDSKVVVVPGSHADVSALPLASVEVSRPDDAASVKNESVVRRGFRVEQALEEYTKSLAVTGCPSDPLGAAAQMERVHLAVGGDVEAAGGSTGTGL